MKRRPQAKFSPDNLGTPFCEDCFRGRGSLQRDETLVIHHVKPISRGGKDTESNVVVLCSTCHNRWHRCGGFNVGYYWMINSERKKMRA